MCLLELKDLHYLFLWVTLNVNITSYETTPQGQFKWTTDFNLCTN